MQTNIKTIVLVFINNKYIINKLESQYVNLTKFAPNGNLKMDLDYFQIIIINLSEELEKIKNNQKVIVKKMNWMKMVFAGLNF